MARFGITRKTISCCTLACALGAPPAAWAVSTANSGVIATTASARVLSRGSVAGTVTGMDGSSFTVQRPGRRIGVVDALIATANRILAEDTPYVYGGGHASAPNASVGIPGPGYNGKRLGFDCSGAVGAVLVGGGLWTAGSGVPRDDGIISQLRSAGMIAPGVGKGPVQVTLWDHPTVHIFMNINGRFFGTSDGGEGGDPAGGAGWLYDGAPDASNPAFKPYHLVPWVLGSTTGSGQSLGLQAGSRTLVGGLVAGEKIRVRYKQLSSGELIATAIGYPGSGKATGVAESIPEGGSSFTIQIPGGRLLTLSTAGRSQLLDGLASGDTVRVTYSKVGSDLIAHTIVVTAPPAPAAPVTPS